MKLSGGFIQKLNKIGAQHAKKAVRIESAKPPSSSDDAFGHSITTLDPKKFGQPAKVNELIDEVLWNKGDEWPGFFRPSMIGGCKRASYFHYTNAPRTRQKHDPQMVRRLKVGQLYHSLVQEYLGNSLQVWFAPESPVWDEQLAVRGKCDGVCISRDRKWAWTLELKTVSPTQFTKHNKPMGKHVWQAHTYAALHGCTDFIDILYINKGTQDWKCWRVEFSQEIWKEIKDWVGLVYSYVEKGSPPRFDASECDPSFCEFATHCFKLKDKEELAQKKKLLSSGVLRPVVKRVP